MKKKQHFPVLPDFGTEYAAAAVQPATLAIQADSMGCQAAAETAKESLSHVLQEITQTNTLLAEMQETLESMDRNFWL